MTRKAIGVLVVAASLSGCITHGPDGVAYSTGGAQNVGVTRGEAGGALGGAGPPAPQVEKEQRGSTPVGVDRDGHGPAAGAIVDPTGAATRGKPY
jgi:hypothetical protein